jgi:hypothetical protein
MAFVRKGTHAIPTPTVLVQGFRCSFLAEYVYPEGIESEEVHANEEKVDSKDREFLE